MVFSINKIFKKKNIKVLYLLILFLSMLYFYNYTNLSGNNWFIHPDDHSTWVFSNHLYKTGELFIEDPINTYFEYPVIRPAGGIYSLNKIVPVKPVGEYYLTAIAFLFGNQGPFYLIPIIGIMGTYFIFRLILILYGNKVALLSVFLIGLSFPIIYWNNMLYSNIPALSFYIMGLYFLTRYEKYEDSFSNIIISLLFFSSSIWLRYEFFIFTLLLLPIFIMQIRNMKYILTIIFIILFIALIPIMISNDSLYGSPFRTGYTYNANIEVTENQIGDQQALSFFQKMSRGFVAIYSRFLTQDFNFNNDRRIKNANDWIYSIFPMILPFAFLGILYAFKNIGNRTYLLSFLLISILWSYDTLGGYHLGENTSWLGSTYIRYLLIVYTIIVIFASVFFINTIKIFKNKLSIIIIFLIVVIYVIGTTNMLFGGSFDLKDTTLTKQNNYEIDSQISELPDNSIIITNLIGKAIIHRKVYFTPSIKNDIDSARNRTTHDIFSFLKMGFHVYLLESPSHKKTYLNMKHYLQSRYDHKLKIIIVNEKPKIYEIILKSNYENIPEY